MASITAGPDGYVVVRDNDKIIIQQCAPEMDLMSPYKVKEYDEDGRHIVLILVPCAAG